MPPRAVKAGGAGAPAAGAPAEATAAVASKPRKRAAKAAERGAAGPGAADVAAADSAPAPAKKPRARAPRPPKGSGAEGSDILNALPDAALSHVLALLPMDVRARTACVCRRWRALVGLIQSSTISFKGALSCRVFVTCACLLSCTDSITRPAGVTVPVDLPTLRALLTRAGPALRCLNLEGFTDPRVEDVERELWLVPFLIDAACFGLEELWIGVDSALVHAAQMQQLQLLYPRLRKGCVAVICSEAAKYAEAAFTALPGFQRRLLIDPPQDFTQVAAALQGQVPSASGVVALAIAPQEANVRWHSWLTRVEAALDLHALATALDAMPALQDLFVYSCQIGNLGSETLMRHLNGAALRSLRLHRCQMTLTHAAAALGFPRLEVLNLAFNPGLRDDRDVDDFGAAIKSHLTLRELNIDHCDVSAAVLSVLGDALEVSRTLQSLSLTGTPSFRRGSERFLQGLERNSSLRVLNLARCALDAAGARAAARAIARQGHLERLSLAGNELSDDGAVALAVLLQHKKCTLRDVSLESNGITGPGGVALGAAIGRNTSLTALNMSENQCGVPAAAKGLAAGLAANKTLQKLEVAWWSLGGGAFAALGRAAGAHPKLRHLDLSFNDAGDAGARVFAAALERPGGCALRTLLLNDCNVGGSGARAFAKALRANATLRVLMLRGNDDINAGAFNALRQAFRDNTALRELQLGPELPDLDRYADLDGDDGDEPGDEEEDEE